MRTLAILESELGDFSAVYLRLTFLDVLTTFIPCTDMGSVQARLVTMTTGQWIGEERVIQHVL
jgi:hypothetical protein